MNSTDPLKHVQNNLQLIGVDPETTQVYAEMLKLGPASALQISKSTGISRTQTYRHLDQLKEFSLASAEQLSYGTLFRALPLQNIEALITSRETETAHVRRSLDNMAQNLELMTGQLAPKSSTYHYYGLGGVKQVNWNLTRAKKEFRVFEAAHLDQHLDKTFARRCREQYIDRQLTSYDLTNATSVTAKEIEPFEPTRTHVRHIDPEILRINFEMYIYDEVVTLIDYGDKTNIRNSKSQPHATEIHHATMSAMMRQLFDAMWNLATPLKIT